MILAVSLGIGLSGGSKSKQSTLAPASTPSATAPAATATAAPSASATASAVPVASRPVACNGPVEKLAPAKRTFSAEPPITIDTKAAYTMKLVTSCGPISIALEAVKAPHTINMLSFLAAGKFFDGIRCQRAVDGSGLIVLQCGDPTGTGGGSIGFTIPEENLTGATYPRGTLAMANTGAKNSTGSQFFLVDKDSQLPPSYTVAGHITAGIDVLDKLIAVGNDGSNPAGGGEPNKRIYLQTVTVTKS